MREAIHGGSDGGRSQGGSLSPTNDNAVWRCRGPGRLRGTERPGDEGLGHQGRVMATSGQGGARGPED